MPSPEPDSMDDIDKEYQVAIDAFAEAKVAEEFLIHPNSLLPKKALFERYQKEMQEQFATYRQRQTNGSLRLAEALNELAQAQPELFSAEVFDEINHIADLSARIASDEKGYSEHIAQGGSLQEFAAVSDSTIDKLYQAAKSLYDQRLYGDAADAFFFLIGLNAEVTAFWLGLANAEFHRKKYKEALTAYENAIQALPYDPSVHLAICKCYEALGEKDKALNTLDMGLTVAETNQEYADCKPSLEDAKLRLQNAGY